MSRVAVIGAGAWGTALAVQAARAGNAVALWARDPARAAAIAAGRRNPRLPGVHIPEPIALTADLHAIGAELLILAVPLQHMRPVAAALPSGPPVAVCAKGVELGSSLLPLEVLAAAAPAARGVILTGPNFAHEIAAGLPAAAVVAGGDSELRAQVAAALGTGSFRLYGNEDAIGAQIGGAAKNVIAIAAGAVIGAGLGENARAALVTRGLAELGRLALALGGRQDTVAGLSGIGDLLLTCTSGLSRNYSLGISLGRGERLADAMRGRSGVIEGVPTAPALIARAAAAGVELPVSSAVAALLAGQVTLAEAMASLMSRPRRDE